MNRAFRTQRALKASSYARNRSLVTVCEFLTISAVGWQRHARASQNRQSATSLIAPLCLLANGAQDAHSAEAANVLADCLSLTRSAATRLVAHAQQALPRLTEGAPMARGRGTTAATIALPETLFARDGAMEAPVARLSAGAAAKPAKLLIDLYHPSLHGSYGLIRKDILSVEFPLDAEHDCNDARVSVFNRHARHYVTPVGPLTDHSEGLVLGGPPDSPVTQTAWRGFWQSLDVLQDCGLVRWRGLTVATAADGNQIHEFCSLGDDDAAHDGADRSALPHEAAKQLLIESGMSKAEVARLEQDAYFVPARPADRSRRLFAVLGLAHPTLSERQNSRGLPSDDSGSVLTRFFPIDSR